MASQFTLAAPFPGVALCYLRLAQRLEPPLLAAQAQALAALWLRQAWPPALSGPCFSLLNGFSSPGPIWIESFSR